MCIVLSLSDTDVSSALLRLSFASQAMASQIPQHPGEYEQQNSTYVRQGYQPSAGKPELPRSISTTNLETTRQCQEYVKNDLCASPPPGGTCFFVDLPGYTFTIPHLTAYPTEFRQFIFDRIVDKTAKKSLEEEGCLNWCQGATQLEPLHTKGDGNCLLHAASLGMWGFQDRAHILRNAVSQAVVHAGNESNTLFLRWKYNKELECQQQMYKLEPTQWQNEWNTVVRQASADPTPTATLYSLEEFHVFVLANVLRRPVIMYASQKMRSLHSGGTIQSLNFHGVYLPLLWDPKSCKKDPLPLGYQCGHFSALVVVKFAQQYQDGKLVLPLVGSDGYPLPVRFMLHSENAGELLNDYLSVINVSNPSYTQSQIPCASLSVDTKPAYYDRLVTAFIEACHDAYLQQQTYNTGVSSGVSGYVGDAAVGRDDRYATTVASSGGSSYAVASQQRTPNPYPPASARVDEHDGKIKCINNCGMYGDPETAGLCSHCHKKSLDAALEQERPNSQSHPPPSDPVFSSSSMTGVSIKCPNCSQPGHPKYLGMCENCYHGSQQSAAQPQYGNQTAQPQHLPPTQYGNQTPQPMYGNQQQQPLYGNEDRVQPQYGNQRVTKEPDYESLDQYQKPPIPPRPDTVSPPPVPLPRSTASDTDRHKCRTPGCEFFGTSETRFYCSKCFDRDIVSILNEVSKPSDVPAIPPVPYQPQNSQHNPGGMIYVPEPPVEQSPSKKCSWCHEYFGAPEYGGLCHGCAKSKTKEDSSAKKCPSCKDFYGSDECGGLCNACFLKKTERETAHAGFQPQTFSTPVLPPVILQSDVELPPPAFDFGSQPPLPPKPQQTAQMLQPNTVLPQHYLQPKAVQPSGSALPSSQMSVPTTRPIPKPRNRTTLATSQQHQADSLAPTYTAPIASHPTSAMAAWNISNTSQENCFLCSGMNPDMSKSYSVCQQHAQQMTKQFPLATSSTQQQQHLLGVPSSSNQIPVQASHISQYNGTQSYMRTSTSNHQQYVQQQYPTQADTTHIEDAGGRDSSHPPHPGSVAMKTKPHPPVHSRTGYMSGVAGPYHSHTPTLAGSEQYPAQHSHNSPHYPVSSSASVSRGSKSAFNNLNTNTSGTGISTYQEEMGTIGRGIHSGQVQAQAHGVLGGSGGIIGSGDGHSVGIQAGVPPRTTTSEATGSLPRKEKILCKTAGCAFYANPRLENFCTDCYKEYYEVEIADEQVENS